jgi:hypothetical protein
MSQTTDSELIALADGVIVQDAFVDWNINGSNPPTLMPRTNAEIGLESFKPFDPSTDVVDEDRSECPAPPGSWRAK